MPGAVGLFAACLLLASPSFAQVPTRLVYVRSPDTRDCPDQSALEAAVAARLGYEPFSPWGDQTIIAAISRSNGGLVARAELVDHDGVARGSRQVQVRRAECKELIATLALAVSITLDPTHAAAPRSSEPKATLQPANDLPANVPQASEQQPDLASPPDQNPTEHRQAHLAPSDEPTAPQPLPRRIEPVSLHAHAGAFGAFALAPAATLGVRIGAGLRRGTFSLWLAGVATLPRGEVASQATEIRINLLSSELALCGEVIRPLSLCGLSLLGAMRGEGVGVSVPKKESSFYASVGARGLLFVPLGPVLALVGTADLSGVLTRPTFQLEGIDVWQPAAMAFGAGIGITGRFL